MSVLYRKDEYGWKIGRWSTPLSIIWIKDSPFRWYGIRFDDKYNTLCFGRLEIRIWKPRFMRSGEGIYLFREVPYDKNKTL